MTNKIANKPWAVIALLVALVAVVLGATEGVSALVRSSNSAAALERNPYLDPGTQLHRRAPDFTLSDQFGRRLSLTTYRGKVVILAFVDSRCTTICPLTTNSMVQARRLLGGAGSRVALLGINANPTATKVSDVRAYSLAHGMMRQWRFLTAPPAALRRVWARYGIAAEVEHGQIDHTPALFAIDPKGLLRRVYLTQMSYATVGQAGQLLAQEASRLLPDHPPVLARLSYQPIPSIKPDATIALPRAGGGTVRVGPGPSPRLYLFFASWDSEVTNLAAHLDDLNRYQRAAARDRLPALTAVDEGSVEPSAHALSQLLGALPKPLSYPVAIDRSGRVADGYGVQDEPWLVLTSAGGQILWYSDVSTSAWPALARLASRVRGALSHAPPEAAGLSSALKQLRGSPPPLAALHREAGQLLGSGSSLSGEIRSLRGYPAVINAWASWCTPCQQEFGLFAAAAARFGRRVAFLGADTDDSAGAAQAFLRKHPVTYPSYQTTVGSLRSMAAMVGLPTTIFIGPTGKVLYVHSGQYVSEGTLEQDIQSFAHGG
ncbi:MAG: redoxin domain-containing protein [Solirubrobacterales bacterium]|nr:redoxin domain-containing protein [Solirubrobacterales bacterium]MBV9536272.1 redoxin domain-containing protein [Solirubrobacterales bacterium]